MSERIENIRKAVEKHAGCRAEHRESVLVTEDYLDQIMWEGVVEVFDLDQHPTAKRAYGWQFWEGKNAQYTVYWESRRLILQVLLSGLQSRQKHNKCIVTRSDDRAGGMRTLIHASFYTFGGAAWTFLALHIQEHFFWPEDLTPHQQRRLDSAKWWITLMGAIVGLLVSAY